MREKHISFIEHLKSLTGLSYSAIARKAEIAETTITRFISKESFDSLSQQTLDKIARVGGYDNYEDFLFTNKLAGSPININKVKISDAKKFEIYEATKRILNKTEEREASPEKVSELSLRIIKTMEMMNTDFVTDSFIMYMIEKERG